MSRYLGGMFIGGWRSSSGQRAWHERSTVYGDDGKPLMIGLRRLRKTEQVLNGESRQNTPEKSEEHYRKNDPQTVERAAATILAGQTDARDHAEQTVARLISAHGMAAAATDPADLAEELGVDEVRVRELVSGTLDTVAAACLDMTRSPHSEDEGGECTASLPVVSGMSSCRSRATTSPQPRGPARRLRARCTLYTPDKREQTYDVHIARLRHLLGQVPKAELKRARDLATTRDVKVIGKTAAKGIRRVNPLDYRLPESGDSTIRFTPEMLVLQDVDDWSSVPPEHVSRFTDNVWYLYPAARKPTARTIVNFTNSPSAFRESLKRIVWCLTNLPTAFEVRDLPPELCVIESVPVPSPSSIGAVWRHSCANWRGRGLVGCATLALMYCAHTQTRLRTFPFHG